MMIGYHPQHIVHEAEASSHTYLGDVFQPIHTRNIFNVNNVVDEIPLLLLSGVILFPGDTLPLRIHKSTNAALYSYFTLNENNDSKVLQTNSEHNMLGIVNEMRGRDSSRICTGDKAPLMVNDKEICPVGVLVDILSFHRENVDEVMMIAKSRQRFELKEVKYYSRILNDRVSRFTVGQLKILGDMEPHYTPTMMNPDIFSSRTSGGSGYHGNCESQCGFLQHGVNPFPQWVYNMNCSSYLTVASYNKYISSLEWQVCVLPYIYTRMYKCVWCIRNNYALCIRLYMVL